MHPILIGRPISLGLSLTRLCRPSVNSIRLNSSVELNDTKTKVGDVIHGFKLEQVDYIKELNIKPYYLRHQDTGAEHLHISKADDKNNVFAVSLRTTPKDSTGVSHILEHSALCGSQKYAVRDPFFKMLTRSLATFMNALTGSDLTVYPFSTQNRQDFENLLRVYTDAVFFPRLRPVDFRQEGWRLEHEKPDKKDTPIVIRGVVYNEMKGVFSSSPAIYAHQILHNLFPDTTYRFESGGDPEHIPDLSHSEFKKFHKLHYHPSNAKFFTYGDIPLEHHLKLLDETVMSKFKENRQAREQSIVTEQEAWQEPRTVEISCPYDPLSVTSEKQTTTSISYLLPTSISNLEEMFSLQILNVLLISGPNAPFYKNLLESGLGADYSPSTGLATETKQPYFSIGLTNISRDDIHKVHQLIEDTFIDVAEVGFASERIEAVLHNIEIDTKHISGNFGLQTLMSILSTWNHDSDVIESMKINKFVEGFRRNLAADPSYWNKLIKKCFLENKHKLILNMSPERDFEQKRNDREARLLETKISQLDEVGKQTVLYEGMELQKFQNSKDDPSILPCLDPSKDIPKDLTQRTDLKFDNHNGVHIQLCEQPTNEVVYFRAILDISEKLKTSDLVDYLPLFCEVATKLGAGSLNRQQFSQQAQLTTGGLSINLVINPSLSNFGDYRSEILLSSRCLNRNVCHTFDLWNQIFQKIHFDDNKEYLSQLIKSVAADLASGVPFTGNSYASKKAASGLSELSALDERLSGLTYIARIKDMASKEPIDTITSNLKKIAAIVLDTKNFKCALNMEPDVANSTIDSLKGFIETIQANHRSNVIEPTKSTSLEFEPTKIEDLKLPFATHYVAKSLASVPRLHEDFPKLVIMAKLITSRYLLKEVREKGGAYGAGLVQSNSGTLNFSSYRDPNTSKTMAVFDHAALWVEDGKDYTDKDIEESKLAVFQSVDKPIEPGRRGLEYFLSGETDEIRQNYRRKLLGVTKSDVQAVAREYLNGIKLGTYII